MKATNLKEALLYRKIVEWNEDQLVLDDGTKVTIEMTESDCCATAGGSFSNVTLDAVITDVVYGEEEKWGWKYTDDDSDSYGTDVKVVIYHNQNPIAQADLEADAGNGGYYYSVASFIVTSVDGETEVFYGVSS